MKNLKFALFCVYTILTSIITFFTFNLVTSAISNYAVVDKLLVRIISFLPMFMFMLVLVTIMVGIYNIVFKNRKDVYFVKQYSLTIGIMSLLGVIFSILTGTVVYNNFFGDYIFIAYPFIMLLVHLILCGVSAYFAVTSILKIKKEKPEKTFIAPKLYTVRMGALSVMLVYALEKLGAFVLLPIYWSTVDSAYVIPYLLELLVPAFLMATHIIYEDIKPNHKTTLIISAATLGFSVLTLVYMLILANGTYPLVINPLSPILQLERLTTMPLDTVVLYGLCIIVPLSNVISDIMVLKKNK